MKTIATKVKSNALWNGLTAAQRESLTEWLFEERMSYFKVWERAKKEFGFKGSISSIRRFYERTARERLLAGFTESRGLARDIEKVPVETAAFRQAGLKVVGRLFLRQVTEAPEQAKDWTPMARLLLQNEEIENRRALKAEENEIRRGNLEVARERLRLKASGLAEETPPATPEDLPLSAPMPKYEYNKKANAVRRRMFGPRIDPLPESAEEEEAIEAPLRAARAEAEAQGMRDRRASWERAFAAGDPAARACRPPPLPEEAAKPEPDNQGQAEA